ncbi:hypothetical protein, partial [Trueperella pyogenes]
MYNFEIGAKSRLTTEQLDQLECLTQAHFQDLRNWLATDCAEYAADELAGAGYTAEQVRGIIEEDRHREYRGSDAYRK